MKRKDKPINKLADTYTFGYPILLENKQQLRILYTLDIFAFHVVSWTIIVILHNVVFFGKYYFYSLELERFIGGLKYSSMPLSGTIPTVFMSDIDTKTSH